MPRDIQVLLSIFVSVAGVAAVPLRHSALEALIPGSEQNLQLSLPL